MLLTAAEAAKVLRVSERTLYTLATKGEIRAVRFGKSVRYTPEALAEAIAAHTTGAPIAKDQAKEGAT